MLIPLVINVIGTLLILHLLTFFGLPITTSVAYFKVFPIIRSHQQKIQVSELSRNVARPTMNFAKYTEKKLVFTILYVPALFFAKASCLY